MKQHVISIICVSVLCLLSLTIIAESALPGDVKNLAPLTASSDVQHAQVTAKMATMQVPFIQNQGQMDGQVAFYANTFSGTVFVTHAGQLVYALPGSDPEGLPQGMALTEEFVGGAVRAIHGSEEAVTRVNYFRGNDASQWRSQIPTYQSIQLGEVYPGIEVELKAHGNNVEKLFIVQPGAAPDAIRLSLQGAQNLTVNAAGELDVQTALGPVSFTKPVAYQEIDGATIPVHVAYAVENDQYGFAVGEYDHTRELVIDPLLASTFLGQLTNHDIAIDGSGYLYVVGCTGDPDFPITPGGYDETYNGASDAFVAKFSNDLSTLVAFTFIGGNNDDEAHFIAVNGSGNVYVTGQTASTNFPTTIGAYDETYNNAADVFVSKLSSDLSTLLASSFLGGSDWDKGVALVLDDSSNVYLTGETSSSDFPIDAGGAYDSSFNGNIGYLGTDVFISRLNSDLSGLTASTFLGGSGAAGSGDSVQAITRDGNGNIYVTDNSKYSREFLIF